MIAYNTVQNKYSSITMDFFGKHSLLGSCYDSMGLHNKYVTVKFMYLLCRY